MEGREPEQEQEKEQEKKSVTAALILLQLCQWDYMTMQGYHLCIDTKK